MLFAAPLTRYLRRVTSVSSLCWPGLRVVISLSTEPSARRPFRRAYREPTSSTSRTPELERQLRDRRHRRHMPDRCGEAGRLSLIERRRPESVRCIWSPRNRTNLGLFDVAGRPSRVTVYQRLEEAVAELGERLGGLPTPTEAEDIWSDIWHQEAHNSTAIEGNILVLREVERLLDEGKAVGSKPLRDYMEVRGHGDAARWVYGQALEPGEWNNGRS